MNMYQEIAHAARLLAQDKSARAANSFDGLISPQAKKAIKDFQWQAKRSFQAINSLKNFYIKSFFYDTQKESLILYSRIMGNNIKIVCKAITHSTFAYTTESGGKISYSVRRLLTACLSYYIPSENSLYNYTAISLMPDWRTPRP